jgi:hypothetical protein
VIADACHWAIGGIRPRGLSLLHRMGNGSRGREPRQGEIATAPHQEESRARRAGGAAALVRTGYPAVERPWARVAAIRPRTRWHVV